MRVVFGIVLGVLAMSLIKGGAWLWESGALSHVPHWPSFVLGLLVGMPVTVVLGYLGVGLLVSWR